MPQKKFITKTSRYSPQTCKIVGLDFFRAVRRAVRAAARKVKDNPYYEFEKSAVTYNSVEGMKEFLKQCLDPKNKENYFIVDMNTSTALGYVNSLPKYIRSIFMNIADSIYYKADVIHVSEQIKLPIK